VLSKKIRLILGACLLLILVAVLVKFVFVSEAERIERTLKQAIEDVRNERVDECMSHISVSRWDSTQASREDLRALIEEGFAQFDRIKVIYDDYSASVTGKEATVTVKVKVVARYDDQLVLLLGTLTEGRRLELGFVKEGKRWLVSSIRGVEIPTEVFEEM
jgi:hypothetical protein